MRAFSTSSIAVLVLTVASLTGFAQEADKQARHHKLWEALNALSPDDHARLRTARKQALENPEVRAADERRKKADAEYRELLDREMLRIDPSLKPLLDSLGDLRKRADY
jgi:predicted DNA-binding transcriptional regulator YafY